MFFEVQVGAFENSEHAEMVLQQVNPWFPKAYIAPREGPGREYYRVRVGPFASKESAQRIANSLKCGGHHVFLDEVPESAVPEEAGREVQEAVDTKTR
jgi:cell division septation protein DedD